MILWLIVILTIVPLMLGALITYPIKRNYSDDLMFWYAIGLIMMAALFQLICVPLTFFRIPFHTLAIIYNALLTLLVLCSAVVNRKRLRCLSRYKVERSVFLFIAIGLIMIQIVTSVVFTPQYVYSGDDTTYITMANDSVESDTIYLTDYMTGKSCTLADVSPKYTLTSYIMFTAYLAKVSGLHVLIVCKTILPVVIIAVAYMIFWQFGLFLFKGNQKNAYIFLIFVSMLNLFGAFSNYTLSFRLLVCSWQGKAWMAAVVLPFLFYYAAKIFEREYSWAEILIVAVAMVAASAGSLFGNGLAPLMLMILAVISVIKYKRWKNFIMAAICCIPCGGCVLLYRYYDIILGYIR